jgi:hypothetical protein
MKHYTQVSKEQTAMAAQPWELQGATEEAVKQNA